MILGGTVKARADAQVVHALIIEPAITAVERVKGHSE